MSKHTTFSDDTYDYEEMDLEIYGSKNKASADFLAKEIAESAMPEAKNGKTE